MAESQNAGGMAVYPVIVPYVDMHPLTRMVLKADGIIPISYGLRDRLAYSELLRIYWKRKKTFFIVEQDILPWPRALHELADCQCHWGTYSYKINGGIGVSHMLGCCKITDRLIAATPGIWDSPVHWSVCDQHLARAAMAVGQEPHLHRPAVLHMNHREIGASVDKYYLNKIK